MLMAELGNEQNCTFPKSSHLCPKQQQAHTYCTKLQVMLSGPDLEYGRESPEETPLLCLQSPVHDQNIPGRLKSESGQVTSAEDNSFLCSLSYLAHMYYTLVPFIAG